MPDATQGLIRIKYWSNRELRGGRTSGYEVHGLTEAPDSVLTQAQHAIGDELARRNPAPEKPEGPAKTSHHQ